MVNKKVIFFFILLFTFPLFFSILEARNNKIIYKKPKCLFGFLYMDWKNKPGFVAIPVLDKNGQMIQCKDNE